MILVRQRPTQRLQLPPGLLLGDVKIPCPARAGQPFDLLEQSSRQESQSYRSHQTVGQFGGHRDIARREAAVGVPRPCDRPDHRDEMAIVE